MVIKIFFAVMPVLLCIFQSCNNKVEPVFYRINNESLVQEIINYRDSVNVPSSEPKIVNVMISTFQDTTTYMLLYAGSACGLSVTPSTVYSKVKGNIVALSYRGVEEIDLPDSMMWKYVKDVFPKEYEYYVENGDFPPPPTAREVLWILKFTKGQMISKKVIVN